MSNQVTSLLVVVAALLAAPSAVFAQPVRPGPPPPRPTQPARPSTPTPDPALAPPALPEPPEALRGEVERLHQIALRTVDCWDGSGPRVEHTRAAGCPEMYRSLERGGEASAFAIGKMIVAPRPDPGMGVNGIDIVAPRLVQILASTRSAVGVPFMLKILADQWNRELDATAKAVLEVLPMLTGNDPNPLPPWREHQYSFDRERAVRAWLAWYRAEGANGRAAWLTAGAARARTDLASTDHAVRFSAVRRLADDRSARRQVQRATQELLAMRDLPADARAYVRAWSRRGGPAVPRDVIRAGAPFAPPPRPRAGAAAAP